MTGKITPKISQKLEQATQRLGEIGAALLEPSVNADSMRIKELYIERAEIAPLVELFQVWQAAGTRVAEAASLHEDPDLAALAEEEQAEAASNLAEAENNLLAHLAPKDVTNDKNTFVEIRAGTGGSESCLFAGDLLRMYTRWAENHNLKIDVVSKSEGEIGGFREVIAKIKGKNAHALFKHEAGAHRVQRVPETESQGRIHTSVCTVAVMPEAKLAEVGIKHGDLRYDTFRASGAGGQHVNTTDSAVRITHLPTGMVAECQAERSQHRNRETALSMLVARINEHHRQIHARETESARREMVGSGQRNEKIRTYNFPQSRVTDHRVGLTIRRLREILEGDLNEFYLALSQAERAEQLARAAELA